MENLKFKKFVLERVFQKGYKRFFWGNGLPFFGIKERNLIAASCYYLLSTVSMKMQRRKKEGGLCWLWDF